MRLGIKIGLSLTGVVGLALAFACLLYYVQYETVFSSLQTSRMAVLTTSIRDTIQGGTNLGLSLKDMRDVQGVIERTRALDDDIIGITVFDRTGAVLFDTDPARIGMPPTGQTRAWAKASVDSRGPWNMPDATDAPDGGAAVTGAAVVNSFDVALGGVALRYSRAVLFAGLKATALALGKAAGLILAAVAVAVLLLVHLLLRPLTRAAGAMEHRLHRLEHDGDSCGPDGGDTPATDLETELAAFRTRARAAMAALALNDPAGPNAKHSG